MFSLTVALTSCSTSSYVAGDLWRYDAHVSCDIIVIWEFNTLRLRQNGSHYTDDIFNCVFLNENMWILIKIWRKFVPKYDIPALVQIMVWRRPGDKPLYEAMLVRLPTHICALSLSELMGFCDPVYATPYLHWRGAREDTCTDTEVPSTRPKSELLASFSTSRTSLKLKKYTFSNPLKIWPINFVFLPDTCVYIGYIYKWQYAKGHETRPLPITPISVTRLSLNPMYSIFPAGDRNWSPLGML